MEDPNKKHEQHAANEREMVVVCANCDNFIYVTKIAGVDRIVYCGGCNERYVLSDAGLRKE